MFSGTLKESCPSGKRAAAVLFSLFGIWLGFSVSLGAQTAPPTYSGYTGTDVKTIPPAPRLGPANTVITDPTFGSSILRVTDPNSNGGESFVSTDSGFHRAWNADSTAIKLTGPHGDGYWMEFNPGTFKAGDGSSKTVPHPVPFGANWEWSTVDPNIIYFLNGSQIAKYNKATGVQTNLGGPPNGDPVTYSAVVVGLDNWVCAAAGKGSQDTYTEIYCLNPASPGTNEFIDVYNKTVNGIRQGDPNWPTSASGQVIGIHDISGGTGSRWLEVTFHQQSWGANGGAVLDLGTNTWSEITNGDLYWGGHVSMGNGKYANSAGSVDGRDSRGIVLRNPDSAMNSSQYQFVSQPPNTNNGWCDADHTSWLNSIANPNAPILVSRYMANAANCAFAWTGEIYAAAVDGSNTVWRFAHNHDGGCYYGEGFAQISNDGKWALFSSYWDGTLGSDTSFGCQTRIDTFIVQLTSGGSSSTPPLVDPPVITTSSIPNGTQNLAYSATLAVTLGTAPYKWSIISGSLPAGLTLGANSGIISGTPTGSGTNTFTVQVSDANAQKAGSTLSLSIAAAAPPPAAAGIALVQSTKAELSGVTSVSAAFPANNQAGNLIIAFVRMSTTSQTVTVSDSLGNSYTDAVKQAQSADGHQVHLFYARNIRGGANSVTASFSAANNHPWLAVYEYSGLYTANPLDQIASGQNSGSNASIGPTATTTAASELVFAASGLPASFTGTVAPGTGYLVTLQDTGTSRAANETANSASAQAVTAGFTFTASTNWSMVIATFRAAGSSTNAPPPSPPSITTTTLPAGTQGQSYSATASATSGTSPYSWSIVSGSLPTGVTLASTGIISGVPTGSGTSSFALQVMDAKGSKATASLSLTINAAPQPPVITTTSFPNGNQNTAYSGALSASGGTTPYTWSVISGSLPAGLTLGASTGMISGTPTGSGASTFSLQVTDAKSLKASATFTLTINAAVIRLVQSNAVEGSGLGSISAPFSSANQKGNLIIAFVRMSTSSQSVTIRDTSGNVYADAVSQAQTTDGHQIHVFYARNIIGGANSVTASFSGTNNHPWLAVYEYSGLNATAPLDGTAHAQGSSSTANSGATTSTTSANELVFVGVGLPSSYTGTVSPAGGYALVRQDLNTSRAANETTVVNSAGSYSGGMSLSPGTNWSAVIATFKP